MYLLDMDILLFPSTKIGSKIVAGSDNVVIVRNSYRIICSYDEYMGKIEERWNII